jgi:sporulation protein YabP
LLFGFSPAYNKRKGENMVETVKKHTLIIDNCKKVSLTGLTGVVSIFEKEIEVTTENQRIIIKGSGLNANKLNVEDGTLVVDGDFIASVTYTDKAKRLSLKGMFK